MSSEELTAIDVAHVGTIAGPAKVRVYTSGDDHQIGVDPIGVEVTADQARVLAEALVAAADHLDERTTNEDDGLGIPVRMRFVPVSALLPLMADWEKLAERNSVDADEKYDEGNTAWVTQGLFYRAQESIYTEATDTLRAVIDERSWPRR